MIEVAIFGYLGFGNLGDETNLRELIRLFSRTKSKVNLSVITASPEITMKQYHVTAIHRNHFREILLKLKHTDYLIACGGTLFQDRTSLRSLIYYSLLVLAARFFHVKIFLYAQGVGPITSLPGKFIARLALAAANVITVRDRLSVLALMKMNLKRPEIYLTAEPLLALEAAPGAKVDAFWKKRDGAARFGLIIKKDAANQGYWKALLETLKWERRLQPFLIVIAKQDWAFGLQLASTCGIELVRATDSWEQCQLVMAGMQCVFSCRLHGLVAAVTQGVPCCGLSTDPKIDGFCLQWDIPLIPLSQELDPLAMCNRITDILAQTLKGEIHPTFSIDFCRERALENQTILRRFLKA